MSNVREKFGVRIQHAGIHVKNYEESAKWYSEIFGFEEVDNGGGSMFKGGVFPKMRWMRLGDFMLEVYEVQDAQPFNLVDFEWTRGVKHLNFAVKDFEGFKQYIKERGDVEIVVDNIYGPDAGALYILDNDGVLVEVTPDF